MAGATYHVFIRNVGYQFVDVLNDWLSFRMVRKFNALGRFTLTVSADSPAASLLTETSGIVVVRRMVDDDSRTVIFSGSASKHVTTATTITLEGEDDMVVLAEALVRPVPSQNTGPFGDEFFIQSGQASAVLIELALTAVGNPSAPSNWEIPQLTANADPALGGTIYSQANLGDRVLDVMAALAVSPVAGGLGFSILQAVDYTANIELQIYAPRDRTAEVIFGTSVGTILDFEDTYERPQFNYFYVAGDGLGADRTIIEGGNAASIAEVGRRIPFFHEARGVTDATLLAQKLEELKEGAVSSRRMRVTPFQVQSLQYGEDWELGDLVTVVGGNGAARTAVIRELEIDLDPRRGVVLTPTIGDPGTTNDERVAQHIQSVQRRVSYLEANYRLPEAVLAQGAGVGSMRVTAAAVAASGWLLCQGQAISRTTYAALHAVIGDAFGAGNGTTTFNIPDGRGRFVMGSSGSYALGSSGGAASVDLGHDHNNSTGTSPQATNSTANTGAGSMNPTNHTHSIPSSLGTTSILPPYLVGNWEIYHGVL